MNYILLYSILFITGFIGTYLVIPMFKNMLVDAGIIRPNYKGEMIPVSMGIVFLPMLIIGSIILVFTTADASKLTYYFMFDFALISMFFAGIIDDIIGNRGVSGLSGHFKSLFKGKLTTGGFKALFGGFVGILISVSISRNIGDIVVNTLIIALSTNLMNLLDLRPGRAIKAYLVIMIPIAFTVASFLVPLPLLILPNVIAYFYTDLKARAMMGDTGSNVLGISIGFMFVAGYSFNVRISWLVFLILIHALTEKYSLTKIIEKVGVLNFIDRLGR
ncbi:MAG: glycosyl transferase [Clostridioides sp.]|nr:glycosyl transferase [Clostridioides sp.]